VARSASLDLDQSHWLTTDRLALRRITTGDRDWLMSLYADPEVARYVGGVRTPSQVEELMQQRFINYYVEHPGLGVWLTIERASGRRVGLHNLNHIQGETIVQVGFILAQAFWGRGFAAEMATALLRYGFATLGYPTLVGMASPANVGSVRVLEKIGLHRRGERRFSHPAYAGEALAWFERDAADWLAERPA
jgi:ribosomal-protein-alanine N-acetyltransferase